jgi:hypothetical protein
VSGSTIRSSERPATCPPSPESEEGQVVRLPQPPRATTVEILFLNSQPLSNYKQFERVSICQGKQSPLFKLPLSTIHRKTMLAGFALPVTYRKNLLTAIVLLAPY